jgi:hypothetical protein
MALFPGVTNDTPTRSVNMCTEMEFLLVFKTPPQIKFHGHLFGHLQSDFTL